MAHFFHTLADAYFLFKHLFFIFVLHFKQTSIKLLELTVLTLSGLNNPQEAGGSGGGRFQLL